MADALSRKIREKPIRGRSMRMELMSTLVQMLTIAQTEALKSENVKNEKLGKKIEFEENVQGLKTVRRRV